MEMTPDETTTEEKSSRSYWGFVLCILGVLLLLAIGYAYWVVLEREHMNKVNKRLDEKQRQPTNQVEPPVPVDKDQA